MLPSDVFNAPEGLKMNSSAGFLQSVKPHRLWGCSSKPCGRVPCVLAYTRPHPTPVEDLKVGPQSGVLQ